MQNPKNCARAGWLTVKQGRWWASESEATGQSARLVGVSTKQTMKGVLRSAKNFTKGYSEIQAKVREATSNEDWGPTMVQLEHIAESSFQPYPAAEGSIVTAGRTKFSDIIYIIDKRLNDHGKNWRHVYKTLLVLEFCICCGSDSMVSFAKERLYEIRTLREFISIDDHGNDNGMCVREKSKDICALLTDDQRLMDARRTKSLPLDRRPSSTGPLTVAKGQPIKSSAEMVSSSSYPGSRRNTIESRQSFEDLQNFDEDAALAMAIEESKAEFESRQSAAEAKDSGFPIFMQNVSRSSSARSSSVNLFHAEQDPAPRNGNGAQAGSLTAEQLLNLDDESFSKALETTFTSSRRPSDIFAAPLQGTPKVFAGSASTAALYHGSDVFSQTSTQKNLEDLFDDRNSPRAYQQHADTPVSPFENPFSDSRGSMNAQFTYYHDSSSSNNNNNESKGPHSIHPIAIPVPPLAELTIGAKPVMPGNLAPQFAQSATPQKYDPSASVSNQGAFVKVLPSVERNESSGTEKDPFADLF